MTASDPIPYIARVMNRRERIECVLSGRQPDHPPISFWPHFYSERTSDSAAVEAHVSHFEIYDLDYLKVMNEHAYPQTRQVREMGDLAGFRELSGNEGSFARQIEMINGIRERVGGDVPICATILNAWATLRSLCHVTENKDGQPDRNASMKTLIKRDREAVDTALRLIGKSLAAFATQCLRAGANGIFLSVRDDCVPSGKIYDELVRPTDCMILDAASNGWFNILHVHGQAKNFRRFADYPVQILNWADRRSGPSIAYARDRVKPAIACGIDHETMLPQATPEDCMAQVRDALRQAKHRPILPAPGCAYDPDAVPTENLKALVAAARQ